MMNTTDFHLAGTFQDTINQVTPQTRGSQSPRLQMPVTRPRIDFERAQEIIESVEQREQEIQTQKVRIVRPRIEEVKKPPIEVDTLLMRYQHIGCRPVVDFPRPATLTVLEQYFQPMDRPEPVDNRQQTVIETGILPESTVIVHSSVQVQPDPGFPAEIRETSSTNMITVFLMGSLIFFTWIKYNFGKNLAQIIYSFFSFQQAHKLLKEHRESDKQAAFFSDILFVFNSGIFFSLLLSFFNVNLLWDSYVLTILFFSMAVTLLYSLKAGIWKLLGSIFMLQTFSKEYVYNMFLYNRNIGLFIFPLLAVTPFAPRMLTPFLLYGAVTIFCIAYLLRIFRIFQIINTQNVSIFYFILYLCTLEILPLLLFVKVCKILSESVMI